MKMKILKNSLVLLALLQLGKLDSKAASVFFDSSLFALRDSSGATLTNTTPFYAAFGWFTGGFNPTLANYSNWLSNFKGVSGYNQSIGGGLNTVSAGITLVTTPGPDNDPELGVYDNLVSASASQGGSLLNLSVGESIPENQQFSVLIFNATTAAGSTQAAVLTNSTWKIIAQFDVASPDTVEQSFGPTGMTSTFGSSSTTAGNRFIQMSVVPEPSTGALMMIGAAGLVALRRLRKV